MTNHRLLYTLLSLCTSNALLSVLAFATGKSHKPCITAPVVVATRQSTLQFGSHIRQSKFLLSSSTDNKNESSDDQQQIPEQIIQSPKVGFARSNVDAFENLSSSIDESNKEDSSSNQVAAATNTINERLLAELKEAEQKERFGARSAAGKKMRLVDGLGRTRKTEEEMKAAIAEARDLNGVNPIVAVLGSFFAFAVAAVLWVSTTKLAGWFATHPPDTDVYFVLRTAQVFRNVIMGLISLASGFFGVTGLGIFLLGVRVAYGVITGELDPTPIQKKSITALGGKKEESSVNMGNMVDLMLNKKPGRRGGGTKKDNDLFGI
ncbi:DUF3082 domain containing protein [Nitzschia inconspicua]|uniref:DUF3082 domain containing protein n=1 Tax=Nitzschia inconspicua TaxID=303405 RepID=A0A9K3PWA0_9STRA|nr:DUF3082 domain containing protein [Nitzschia inconspicua]